MAIAIHIVYGCFESRTAELCTCNGHCLPIKSEIFTVRPFTEAGLLASLLHGESFSPGCPQTNGPLCCSLQRGPWFVRRRSQRLPTPTYSFLPVPAFLLPCLPSWSLKSCIPSRPALNATSFKKSSLLKGKDLPISVATAVSMLFTYSIS